MKFPKKKNYNRLNFKIELYLSEMSYINDTSIHDINDELCEVTPLNSTLTEP